MSDIFRDLKINLNLQPIKTQFNHLKPLRIF
jgi:hypothetical protein